ncbi:MAG: hypothetical protein NXI09_05620 [Bacteroidetes bacterium]|nr:hypothetical protein [Bacteroidota bacterium]
MKKAWNILPLSFLFIAALIGNGLRASAYFQLPFEYGHLVHAHSHVAFQAWIYGSMFLLLVNGFLEEVQIKKGKYLLQFKLSMFLVLAILIAFSLQGYALYSIILSTLFQGLNYWFIYRFFKDAKGQSLALVFIKTGLIFGLISTLLPFAIGALAAQGLKASEAYHSLVFSFLHLQYNAWFLFVALGLFYKFLDEHQLPYSLQFGKRFYQFLSLSVFPAIALSLLGMSFASKIIILGYLAALLLSLALVYFLRSIKNSIQTLKAKLNPWLKLLLFVFLASFVAKTILQLSSVIPAFKDLAFFNKAIIIAYLHLSLIGTISFLLLALLLAKKYLPNHWFTKLGASLLFCGFVGSEVLLVFRGLSFNIHQIGLITASIAMLLGILFFVFAGIYAARAGTASSTAREIS